LGIVSNDELGGNPQHFSWTDESQLVLCSDGLLEATSPQGSQFGVEGLIAATANTSPNDRFAKIEAALALHQKNGVASDDISLMLIDCP
jgi:serine phosphatase RsbU (regulator of sigma subunit)